MSTEHNGEIPLNGSGFEDETPVQNGKAVQGDDLGAIPLEGSGFENEDAEDGGVR